MQDETKPNDQRRLVLPVLDVHDDMRDIYTRVPTQSSAVPASATALQHRPSSHCDTDWRTVRANLQHDRIRSAVRNSVSFLDFVEYVCRERMLSETVIFDVALTELAIFLWLKVRAEDTTPGDYRSPSGVLDAMWHALILDTRCYADFCDRAFGRFVHHEPGVPYKSAEGERRRLLTAPAFEEVAEDCWIWNDNEDACG